MPDHAQTRPPPTQRRVTDTDSDSKSSNTDTAHHRKRLDSTHKKHPLGHKNVKPRMGPRSSSSRQVTQLNKEREEGKAKEEKERRRYSADMDDVSPKNTGNAIWSKKEASQPKEPDLGSSAMGSKSEWDDVVDLDGIKAKALEREASVLSLQGLNLQQRKMTGGMRRNRSAAEMAKRRLLLGGPLAGEKGGHGGLVGLKKSASHTSVNKAHVKEKEREREGGQAGRTSVHFDLGHKRGEEGEEGDDDGWTEASGSASPNLSRSGSVAGTGSGRNSARGQSKTNSETPSMSTSPNRSRTDTRDWSQEPTPSSSRRESHSQNGGQAAQQARHPDATQITTRLLQRVASSSAAPQMSAVSATALPSTKTSFSSGNGQTGRSQSNSDAGHSSGTATPHDLPNELISRFKGSGPGTPGESPSPYTSHLGTQQLRGGEAKDRNTKQSIFNQSKSQQGPTQSALDSSRRAKSMSNLNQGQGQRDEDSDSDRPLAPRTRKSSTAAYAEIPPSRTQQKLWLQRASSNIESAQPGTSSLGLNLALNGLGVSSVLDADGLGGGDGIPISRTLVGSIGYREGEYDVAGGRGRGRASGGDPRIVGILNKGGMTYRAVGRFVDPVVRSLRRLEYIPGSGRGATRIPPIKGNKAQSVRGTKETRSGAGAAGLSQSLKDARGGGFLDRSRKSMDALSSKSGGHARSVDKDGQGSLGSDRTERDEQDEVKMLLRGLWDSNVERSPRKRREGGEVDE